VAQAFSLRGAVVLNRRRLIKISIIVLLLVAIIAGSVCGTGHCQASERIVAAPTESPSASPTTAPSAVPTMAPTNGPQTTALLEYINSITLSNSFIRLPVLTGDASPEEQAVAWLVRDDPLQLAMDMESAANRFRLGQRYALLTLYFSTGGSSWSSNTGWLMLEDECSWFSVTCSSTVNLGPEIGSQNVVTRIGVDESGNNLVGTIPPDLGLLEYITWIDFQNNPGLTGSIPPSFGNFKGLLILLLQSCSLQGTLPEDAVMSWTNLQALSVESNSLTGPLPPSIGFLTSLKIAGFNQNKFNSSLPESLSNCTDLNSFRASDNSLEGTIPESLGRLTALTFFSVSNNNALAGPIPSSLGDWTSIEQFYVDGMCFRQCFLSVFTRSMN